MKTEIRRITIGAIRSMALGARCRAVAGAIGNGVRTAVLLALALTAAAGARAAPFEVAVLQGMDKVTARVSTIEAPIGDVVTFGSLEIIARHCDKRPPEETPESAAFLDIWEVRQGEAAVSLFRGWMYASSPAVSAMEHPVYDVWVLDCKKRDSSAESSAGPPVPK